MSGAATSSFGTHVANLAGVPLEVVERADLISKNFAQQFKEKQEDKKKTSASSKTPLVAQADFAYLFKLATGQIQLPGDPVRRIEVLSRLKETVKRYVQ